MADQPFPWRKTFILGFGFFGISIIWPLFNSLIPPMLEDLGLAATVIGFIMAWDNIINVFLQPYVGSRSDRTHTRFGRRKPWLMLGAPLAAFFFILVPFVRENFVLIALAILGTNLGMALFRSPTVAYLGDLFKPGERSKANGVINLMGGVGGALALFFGGALYKIGVPLPFIVGAGVMLSAIGIVVAFVKEPDLSDQPAGEREPGLWANVKHVTTDRDRSGLSVGRDLRLVRGVECDRGFLHAVCAQRARRGSGCRRADADRLRCHFDHLCDPQRPPGDAHRAFVIGSYTGLYYFASSLAAITGPILAGRLIDWTSYQSHLAVLPGLHGAGDGVDDAGAGET